MALFESRAMRGTDEEEALMPEWVVDVAAERYKVPDAPKVSFYISERADENADESAT